MNVDFPLSHDTLVFLRDLVGGLRLDPNQENVEQAAREARSVIEELDAAIALAVTRAVSGD